MKLKIKKLYPDAITPTKAHDTDAGIDLYSLEDRIIYPGETAKIKTGIAIQPVDTNYYIPGDKLVASLVWDRSSLGSKGIHRMAGVIDQSYTGELLVCLTNLSLFHIIDLIVHDRNKTETQQVWKNACFSIKKGDKIAQLLIQEIIPVTIEEVDELQTTKRGSGGFGSTGQ